MEVSAALTEDRLLDLIFILLFETDKAPSLDSLSLILLNNFTGSHQLKGSEVSLLNVEFLFIDPVRVILLLDITLADLELFVDNLVARIIGIENRIIEWLNSLAGLLTI